jgi:hypothetical protein
MDWDRCTLFKVQHPIGVDQIGKIVYEIRVDQIGKIVELSLLPLGFCRSSTDGPPSWRPGALSLRSRRGCS